MKVGYGHLRDPLILSFGWGLPVGELPWGRKRWVRTPVTLSVRMSLKPDESKALYTSVSQVRIIFLIIVFTFLSSSEFCCRNLNFDIIGPKGRPERS